MATKPFLSQIAVPVGTTTGDVYYPQTSLLMHFNGTNGSTTMTDNSKNNATITVAGNAQLSTAQSKFGGSSAYFDGVGDRLTTPSRAEFAISAVDFTIEGWFYPRTLKNGNCILSLGTGGSAYYYKLDVGDASGQVSLGVNTGTWNVAATYNSSAVISINNWYHVAVVRSGTTLTFYVNGTSAGTFSSANFGSGHGGTLHIGTYFNNHNNDGSDFYGYIDDLRITYGFARYTSNFTPSTTQFLDSTGDANSNVVVNSTATGFAIGTGGINGAQLAKAWVNFNGTGTVSIRDSYNVTSITDLGTGEYTVNYNSFSNSNYCVQVSIREFAVYTASGANITNSSVKLSVYNSSNALQDPTHVFVTIFSN
jgi:hypothetical protein